MTNATILKLYLNNLLKQRIIVSKRQLTQNLVNPKLHPLPPKATELMQQAEIYMEMLQRFNSDKWYARFLLQNKEVLKFICVNYFVKKAVEQKFLQMIEIANEILSHEQQEHEPRVRN